MLRAQKVTMEQASHSNRDRLRIRYRIRNRRLIIIGFALMALIGFFLFQFSIRGMNTPTSSIGSRIENGSWPMHLGGPSLASAVLASQVGGSGQLGNRIAWTFETPMPISSSPAVADGILYITTEDHRVLALRADTGEYVWEFNTNSPSDSTPSVAGAFVFVALREGRLVGLDKVDGSLVWDFHSPEPFFSSTTVYDGILYVGSGDRNIYAFDAVTGEILWAHDVGSRIMTTPSVNEEVVAFIAQDNVVRILDARTGKLRLDYPIGTSNGSPSLDGKRLFFSDFNGSVRAIDWTQVHKPMEKMARRIRLQMYIWGFENKPPVLKGTVWRFRRRSESFQGTPSVSGGAVYVPSS